MNSLLLARMSGLENENIWTASPPSRIRIRCSLDSASSKLRWLFAHAQQPPNAAFSQAVRRNETATAAYSDSR
jgi:hypothetical protein